ncbi:MAG: VWA domain-containing protein [Bifidobacteriaceae bacterium]|nr:VWA domain-containing protein [Bifidobacteriaceae bacterium]
MTNFRFTPIFGSWWVSLLVCAVLLAAFGTGLAFFLRSRATNDATSVDWTRRGALTALICIAIIGPSVVTTTTSQAVNRTDVFFAVDVTGSMAVSDAQYGSSATTTRLDAAKKAVSDIVSLYSGASYAGVSFGTGASLDVPLTPDAHAISTWATNLAAEPTGVSSGSSLDAPLDTLLRTMQQTHEEHPDDTIVMYFISDGEETSTSTRRTFSSLRAFVQGGGAVGTGSVAGGKVPLIEASTKSTASNSGAGSSAQTQQWVTDPDTKKPAVSKLDPDNLKDIADEMSTSYLHVDATHTARALKATVSRQYSMLSTNKVRTHITSFVWPLGIAIFALVLWEFASAVARQRRYL